MTVALAATALMSIGSVALARDQDPLISVLAYGMAVVALAFAAVRRLPTGPADRVQGGRAGPLAVAIAVVALVAGRHVFASSDALAPDDVLAVAVLAGAVVVPSAARWRAAGAGVALATYVVVGAILIAATPYRSDAVVAAHAGAELLLAGKHPYADFDMTSALRRFGLGPEFATPLEDGTRLASLNYPVLAVIAPAPFIAAGLRDVRVLYLAEVMGTFALLLLAVRPRLRAFALAACLGNVAILGQIVVAGVDPLWALLVLGAWVLRRHRLSAVLVGLAVADRQLAWLVAPFLMAWSWRRDGAREALARTALAFGVALALHLPFLVAAPGAVVAGLTDVVLLPLEPRGIGPAGTALTAVVPRAAFLAAAAAAYALALGGYAAGRARAAPLALGLLPLWLSWRALQSYVAFAPALGLLDDEDAR